MIIYMDSLILFLTDQHQFSLKIVFLIYKLMASSQKEESQRCISHPSVNPSSNPQVITRTILPALLETAGQQQQILLKVSAGTFSADKLVRLCSNLSKTARCFSLTSNLKAAERAGMELGQLRRLLRVDRFCLVVRDYVESGKKEEMSGVDWFMVVFRALLMLEDCSDMLAYLIQMGVVGGRKGLPKLRQRVADCYFLECVCWLGLYSYQLLKAKEEDRPKKAGIVLRYFLDSLTSHNDFSARRYSLDQRLTALLGLFSSILNLCLIWQ